MSAAAGGGAARGLSRECLGRVARLTLGADWRFDVAALEALADAAEETASDQGVGAVLIAGPGTCEGFAPSTDRSEADAVALADEELRASDALRRLELLSVPVGCALDGDASVPATATALACHLIFLAEGGRLAPVGPAAGSSPRWGAAVRLARRLGAAPALAHLLLDVEGMEARVAVEAGIACRLAPSGGAEALALETLELVASLDSRAVAASLEAVRHGGDLALEDAVLLEAQLVGLARATAPDAGGRGDGERA